MVVFDEDENWFFLIEGKKEFFWVMLVLDLEYCVYFYERKKKNKFDFDGELLRR